MTMPDPLDAIVAEALARWFDQTDWCPYTKATDEAIRSAVLADRERQAERIAALEARCRSLVEAGDELAAQLRPWASDSEMASTDDSEGAILAWEQTR